VSGLIGKEITTTAVGFYLAPRLNAAGRMKDAALAVDLLLSETREKASEIARHLNSLNAKRQQLQEKYIQQAIDLVKTSGIKNNKTYIISNDEWDQGLIGIVSGRLKDKFNRPVIAFSKDNEGNYVGSARSTDKFHITDALSQFSHLYVTYGGHEKAAGLTIAENNMTAFIENFNNYANNNIKEEDLKPDLIIDSVISPEQLNKSLVEIIRDMGPYGEKYPEPVLMLKNATTRDIFSLSQGQHIKLIMQSGSREFECVWWRKGEFKNIITFNSSFDIAFKPSLNLWNGKENLQLVVEDMRESHTT
jgi:single-stranded-DNA-specific exonuclease